MPVDINVNQKEAHDFHSDVFEGVKSFFLKLTSKVSKTSNINTKAFSITKVLT